MEESSDELLQKLLMDSFYEVLLEVIAWEFLGDIYGGFFWAA